MVLNRQSLIASDQHSIVALEIGIEEGLREVDGLTG